MITPLLLVIDHLYPALQQLALPRTRWFIIGLHLLLLAAIGARQGILMDGEALKYVGCAEDVLRGDFTDLAGNYLKYGAYVLFLMPFVAVGKVWSAVAVQILIGIIAAEALASFTERWSGNVGIGRSAMAVFLLCPLIQTWTLALYTEHFYTCMVILFVEALDRERRIAPQVVMFGILSLFARPVGMFFVVPALLHYWRERLPHRAKRWTVPLGCGALVAFAFGVAHVQPAQLTPIAAGQVIAGVGGNDVQDFQGHTVADAQRFLVERSGLVAWCELSVRKVASLFTLTRPYYTVWHNALNTLFYVLYPLAWIGLWRTRTNDRGRLLLLMLGMNVLVIAATHDEWSGRFLVPLLPWIMVYAVLPMVSRNEEGVT